MALDDTVPADGDGITTGVKVSELAGHIRDLKTDLNNGKLPIIGDADGDTYITVEETADEDKIHFYTAGTEVAEVDSIEFDIKKQLKISGISCMRAIRGTTQSIPNATWTIVQYNTENYDNLGEYDNTTDYRFTAQNGVLSCRCGTPVW